MKSSENFNILFDKKSILSAVEHLARINPLPNITYKDIHTTMMRLASENAKHLRTGEGHFSTFIGTAGYLILMTFNDQLTKKGYPIFDVEVFVSPTLIEPDYNTHKERN